MAGVGAVLDIWSLQHNCANCFRNFAEGDQKDGNHKSYMKNARVSAFVYNDKGRQYTKQVVDGLSETLKFHWLKLDHDGKDFPIVLCYDCSLTFTQLFESYKNFLGKQRPGSILSVINQSLNDLFGKYDTSSLHDKILKDYLIRDKKEQVVRKVPAKRKLLGPARFRNRKMAVEVTMTAGLAAPAQPIQTVAAAEPIPMIEAEIEGLDVDEGPRESVGQMGLKLEERVSVPVPPQPVRVSSLKRPRTKPISIIRTESLASKTQKPKSSAVIPDQEASRFQCPVCFREFPSAFRFECHRNYCKTPHEKPKYKNQCDECGMYFSTEKSLATHKRSHLPHDHFVAVQYKYGCNFPGCDITFDSEDEREMHTFQHSLTLVNTFPSKLLINKSESLTENTVLNMYDAEQSKDSTDGNCFSEYGSIDPLM